MDILERHFSNKEHLRSVYKEGKEEECRDQEDRGTHRHKIERMDQGWKRSGKLERKKSQNPEIQLEPEGIQKGQRMAKSSADTGWKVLPRPMAAVRSHSRPWVRPPSAHVPAQLTWRTRLVRPVFCASCFKSLASGLWLMAK